MTGKEAPDFAFQTATPVDFVAQEKSQGYDALGILTGAQWADVIVLDNLLLLQRVDLETTKRVLVFNAKVEELLLGELDTEDLKRYLFGTWVTEEDDLFREAKEASRGGGLTLETARTILARARRADVKERFGIDWPIES